MSRPDMPPVPAPGPDAPPPRADGAWRRLRRALGWSLAGLLALAIMLAGLLAAALHSEAGTRQLWALATRLSAGMLSGRLEGGTLASGLRLRQVVFASGQTRVALDSLDGQWSFSWSPARLHVQWLSVGAVDVRLGPSEPSNKPLTLPTSLALPLAVDIDALTLRRLALHEGGQVSAEPMVFSDLSASLHTDGLHHRLGIDRLVTPYGKLAADAQLGAQAPFPLSARALLEGRWEKEAYNVTASAGGTLETIDASLQASGDRMRGRASAGLTLFGKVPFSHLDVQGEHINPRLFSPSAPSADLSVQAALKPVQERAAEPPAVAASAARPAGSSVPASAVTAGPPAGVPPSLTVAGEVTIRNGLAGALDAERLPVESVQARVRLSSAEQAVSDLRVVLAGQGQIVGGGSLHDGRGGFDLDVRRLDPRALHGALQSARLSGPLAVRLEPGRQSVALDLADGPLKLFADASLTQDKLTLSTLRAGVGPGQLTAEGELGLAGEQAFRFQGRLANFDPARLVKVAAGRINAEFRAAGSLAGTMRAAVDFTVRDSEYAGLPMRGGGKVQVAGERLLPSSATLEMAGNRAELRGSFGARGDRLKLAVDAPQLERLRFGLAGALKLDADIAGTLKRPEIDASYQARALVFGPRRLASAAGEAHLRPGAGGTLDGPLSFKLAARDFHGPEATLHTIDASLDGTQASHRFALNSTGAVNGRALDATLAGHGAWQGDKGWRGTIDRLEERGTISLRLLAPAPLAVADQHIALGSTRLQVQRATVAIESFDWDHGRLRSQGRLDGVQIGHVLDLAEAFSGDKLPLRSDLVIDGRWNVVLAENATGFAELSRRSGDLSVSAGRGFTTLELGQTALRAEFEGRRLALRGGIVSGRVGKLSVDASAGLLQEQGLATIGPASKLAGQVALEVPRLKAIEALAGPQYAFEGRADARMRLAGSVAAPLLTGELNGDGLGVTLYDLGIRLTDGKVRIALDQNSVELRQVEFHGGDGKLTASGSVQLGDANPNLSGRIVADKLELFSSPERTLIVSGDAAILNENRQIVIRGKFKVDRGLFDLPKAGAPELGDDVVVVRRKDQRALRTAATPPPESRPASRFSPLVELTLDLGNDFRFRGGGADLRLTGQLEVKSAPLTPLRANGTIRVAEGTYEAFGRRLEIDRGIVNFNGPIDNPNLNIRAMRRNQEVSAGVEVTGTVRLPRVQLVSEPDVPQEDKLSWLMFGYGADSASAGQQSQLSGGALGGAALGMIGGRVGKNIVQHFGFDEFSIGPSTAGLNDQQVVSIGRSVTEKISVGYEQSLTSASNVVKLTWALSRRWSLIARGGSINGLSVLFNRRFDRWSDLFLGRSNRRGTRESQQNEATESDGEPAAGASAPAS